MVDWYDQDEEAKQLLAQLIINLVGVEHFTLTNGVIRFQGKIWLGKFVEAQHAVLLAMHASGLGGHSGITATYNRIKNLFYWPGMKKDVYQYVSACDICQQAKPEHCKSPGKLQPLPIPEQAWSTISMDFIEGLPKSEGFDTILVVVDKFSKFAKFIPLILSQHYKLPQLLSRMFMIHLGCHR